VKNIIASIVAAAGIASLANAQATLMTVETSLDGISWASGARNVNPGQTVQFRYKVSFDAGASGVTPVGFASLTFQPTVSNWGNDTLAAFATTGNNTNGGTVTEASGAFGRISPFGSTGPTTSDPYRGHTQSVSGTNFLRIARTTITNWVGAGATTGTSAANNFNGAGGLACVQKAASLVVAGTDPAYNAAISNVVIAKFSLTLSPDTAARTLVIDAPTDGMSRNSTSGAREASWFSNASDTFGATKGAVSVSTASLNVVAVPAPGVLGLMGMGGLVALRRRR
jgi:MYXO-CTERM domain-containing protein